MPMGNKVGQVDHVVMMVWPENLRAAAERLGQMLEIEFMYFEAPDQGIEGAIAEDEMLEFIAPLRDGSGASDSLVRLLEQKGEGIHSITFGVADAHATRKRLDAQGFKTRPVFDALEQHPPEYIKEGYRTVLECHLRERIAGSLFILSQIEPRDAKA